MITFLEQFGALALLFVIPWVSPLLVQCSMRPEILYTTDSLEKLVAVIQDMLADSYPTERAAMTLLLFWTVIIPLYFLPDVK